MGKFDGILICSDWDGTLRSKDGIPEKNIEAIKYFQQNGGIFTVCSGRPLDYLLDFFDKIRPNTYVLTLNGAIIRHPDSKETLFEGFIDDRAAILVKRLLDSGIPFKYVSVHRKSGDAVIRESITSFEEYESIYEGYPIYKIVFITEEPEETAEAKKYLTDAESLGYAAESSWATSIEMLKLENTKGLAVKKLKKHLGARLLVTAGDYENDITMLSAADISYAVGDAIAKVKECADRITVPCADGAMASIIADLEKEFILP